MGRGKAGGAGKWAYRAVLAIALVTALVSGGLLARTLYTGWQEQRALEDLANLIPAPTPRPEGAEDGPAKQSRLPYYQELHQRNPDLGGWVRIEDTRIDYPVMYTPDEPQRYLHRSFEGDYAYSGVPFVDAGCALSPNSTHLLVYGHHMKNGTMFADLMKYQKQEFYEKHPVILFDTLKEEGEYQVMAAFYARVLPAEAEGFRFYSMIEPGSEEQFNEYLREISRVNQIDPAHWPHYGDELLSLVTCATNDPDVRFVVMGFRTPPAVE